MSDYLEPAAKMQELLAWAYLAELDKYIHYCPSGTADTMKYLDNGAVDIIATTSGWDLNVRRLSLGHRRALPRRSKGSTGC